MRDFRIIGVYPVEPTADELEEALTTQWGSDLTGDDLREAKKRVQEHFEGLCLIEVQLEPPNAVIDWGAVTQPEPGLPESSWQVAYDEQPVESVEGRWVFFLHCIKFDRPLSTPAGPRTPLPPTPRPMRLAEIKYEVP